MFLRKKIRQEHKACELRYRPVGTMFFTQLQFIISSTKQECMFNIHHLLFQNQ